MRSNGQQAQRRDGCPGIRMDTDREKPATHRRELVAQLRSLGVAPGDLLMVHASLRALGPVQDGPAGLVQALLDAVEDAGTLMAFVSWEQSPYEATLNGRQLPEAERLAWPAFNPAAAPPYRGFGALNHFICAHPQARRSAHPDASMAAIGRLATEMTRDHGLLDGYGPGSPLERLVRRGGKVLLLGAPLDTVTVLHYAEAVADIPGKRRVRYEVPLLGPGATKTWALAENFDTNGILEVFATEEGPDSVECMATSYVGSGFGRHGRVGQAECFLFDAGHLVEYGRRWLEQKFGRNE
jgi:aminoglycoside N3'-acetyltransferase